MNPSYPPYTMKSAPTARFRERAAPRRRGGDLRRLDNCRRGDTRAEQQKEPEYDRAHPNAERLRPLGVVENQLYLAVEQDQGGEDDGAEHDDRREIAGAGHQDVAGEDGEDIHCGHAGAGEQDERSGKGARHEQPACRAEEAHVHEHEPHHLQMK